MKDELMNKSGENVSRAQSSRQLSEIPRQKLFELTLKLPNNSKIFIDKLKEDVRLIWDKFEDAATGYTQCHHMDHSEFKIVVVKALFLSDILA